MKTIFFLFFSFIIIGLMSLEPHFMNDPAISPDGEQLCFSYLDDLWSVASAGGVASRLTSTAGKDWNPVFSPSGKHLAFNSDRDGWTAIYLIEFSSFLTQPVSKEGFLLLDWFPDGKSMLVTRGEPGFRSKFYRLQLNGEYQEITAFGSNNATVNKKGDKILFDRGGLIYRESYQGSFNGELWEYNIGEKEFIRLTRTDLTEQYPCYSRDNSAIYFSASDGDNFQLYRVMERDFSKTEKLTNFPEWSVRDLSISKEKDKIAFVLFDELWIYEEDNQKSKKIEIEINENLLTHQPRREDVKYKADKFAVSPSGDWIAFSYKFDLFAIPEKGGDVIRITSDQKGISDLQILSDNRTIIFTGYRKGLPQLFRVNIEDPDNIEYIKWSKDKYINWIKASQNRVFIKYSDEEGNSRIAFADSSCSKIRDLVEDKYIRNELNLSPDGKYIAYNEIRPGAWTSHINLHDIDDDIARIAYSSDERLENIFWGKDYKSLFFTRDDEIYRQDLLAKEDFYREENHWQEILSGEITKKTKPDSTVIDFEDLGVRVEKILSRSGNNVVVHVLNDSIFYFLNTFEKKYTLRKSDYFGKSDKSVFTFSDEPESIKFDEINKCFYYIENEKLKKLIPNSRTTELIEIDFKYVYDSHQLNKDIFDQVWLEFGHGFYDPEMHGIDWKRIYNKYSGYLDHVFRSNELKLIISEMIGEVNASHTGFYPRKDNELSTYSPAFCGFVLDDKIFPDQGFYIKDVYRKSKLVQVYNIEPGDVLLQVNNEPVGVGLPFYPQFIDLIGEKIKLEIESEDSLKTISVEGFNKRNNNRLYYDHWVYERGEKVEELSHSKIGYLHIRSMSNSNYDKFLQDLFAENYDKDALIIDVRNNGGGYIHDKLIEVLTKKPYAKVTRRYNNGIELKSPSKLWDKPIVLLINEYSFSDAEIFPYVFRHYDLGKIIGVQTSGSVIGTGHHYFMDGSSMRMPRNGWFTIDGINLEGNGVEPDIVVIPSPEDLINDNDVQLQRAVEELLKELSD